MKEAAIKAIQEGQTKYTAVDGTAELKDAIVKKFKRENNLTYHFKSNNSGSGRQASYIQCYISNVNKGEEVIIPAPYWVSYPDIVLLAGGAPKVS